MASVKKLGWILSVDGSRSWPPSDPKRYELARAFHAGAGGDPDDQVIAHPLAVARIPFGVAYIVPAGAAHAAWKHWLGMADIALDITGHSGDEQEGIQA